MIKQRCYNPKNNNYPNYGGRGVRVCDHWLGENGFENFYENMGPRPSKDYTLERINNDGDYCNDNCKWIPKREQCWNRRPNKIKDLEEANFIRDLYKLGYKISILSDFYNCHSNTIRSIINNKSWV